MISIKEIEKEKKIFEEIAKKEKSINKNDTIETIFVIPMAVFFILLCPLSMTAILFGGLLMPLGLLFKIFVASLLPIFVIFLFLKIDPLKTEEREKEEKEIKKRKLELSANSVLIENNYNYYYDKIKHILKKEEINFLDESIVNKIVDTKNNAKEKLFEINSLAIKRQKVKDLKKEKEFGFLMNLIYLCLSAVCLIFLFIMSNLSSVFTESNYSLENIFLGVIFSIILIPFSSLICFSLQSLNKIKKCNKDIEKLSEGIPDYLMYSKYYELMIKELSMEEYDSLDGNFIAEIGRKKGVIESKVLSNKELYEMELKRNPELNVISENVEVFND